MHLDDDSTLLISPRNDVHCALWLGEPRPRRCRGASGGITGLRRRNPVIPVLLNMQAHRRLSMRAASRSSVAVGAVDSGFEIWIQISTVNLGESQDSRLLAGREPHGAHERGDAALARAATALAVGGDEAACRARASRGMPAAGQ